MRKHLFKHTDRLIYLISGFCLLLIILLWITVTKRLEIDRNKTILSAEQRNSNLAVALEQYAIRTISNADAMLQLMRSGYQKSDGKAFYHNELEKEFIDLNYFAGAFILDSIGRVRMTSLKLSPTNNGDYSDRPYFKFHAGNDSDILNISEPIISRTIGKAVIIISRRINKPDGSFAGIAGVQIEPATFTRFYSSANLRKYDLISLISPSGITYARRTGSVESYGENISASPLFNYVGVRSVGNYFARDAIRNIRTYFSYRKLEKYPMIATVGTTEEDVLSEYRGREKNHYLFGIIVSGLLICFTLVIRFALVQRRKSVRNILASRARYRSIFENSLDAILLLRPDGCIEAMNEAASKLFDVTGKTPEYFNELFISCSPQIDLDFAASSSLSLKKEVICTKRKGQQFTASISISSYKNSDNTDHVVLIVSDITERKEMAEHLMKDQKKYQQELSAQIIRAQEKEREVIGRELHDNVNQLLTSAKLYLEMAGKMPAQQNELISKSTDLILDSIREIRSLTRELSGPALHNQSLIESIRTLIQTVESSSGLHIKFVSDQYKVPLPKDYKLAVYRMLQEQLNNIIKHAAATDVQIELSQEDGKTKLMISDNGKGFDTDAEHMGIGLNNILSRTKILDGQLTIDSAVGKGCRMEIVLPM